MDDADFRSWHEAERAVRALEQRLLLARSPRVAASAATILDLEQRLELARRAADQALSDCLRKLTRTRRRRRVSGSGSGTSSDGESR